ncbi:MAG: transporter substrate-binding domain-containing protein [Pseudomonadota bacterium]
MHFLTTSSSAAVVLSLAASAATFATTAVAAPTSCGVTYEVSIGDTLSRIAKSVYGSPRDFQIIYSANAAIIGPNPGLIEVGMELAIPCLDDVSESVADASAITLPQTTEALPAPEERQIRVVVGTNWAPFTDEDTEQGGMITEITNVALANADGSPDYKIDFINDWGAHLQPLITDHAYDFSIAWFRPNCDLVANLGEGSQFRCNNLAWSEPMFEQILGYYTRVSAEAPASHADLLGKSICRPSGYATFMLEEHNLVEPNITFSQPDSPQDCFQGLADGTYDAVALAADTAEGVIVELGLQDQIAFHEPLSQVLTMHAVIAKTNPNAEVYLATLDSGIRKLKENGEWFSIIRRHLTAHRALTQ